MTESEVTQEIDYRECDTITMKTPSPRKPSRFGWMRAAGRVFIENWDRIWPPMIGVLLGSSAALAFWLLVLLWWLNA